MKILAVMSLKGGVGKTTVAANLAEAFACAGHFPVVAVDLDPQNGLAWHFDSGLAEETGLAETAVDEGWIGPGYEFEANRMTVFPYGQVSEEQRLEFELRLAQHPGWLGAQLRQLFPAPGGVAIIDTPPYASVYLDQALACADHVLIVLTPEVASIATVSDIETMLDPLLERRPELVTHYLLNQVEPGQALDETLTQRMQARFGPRLIDIGVRRDERVAEALAFQQPIIRYDPDSNGAGDINAVADRLGLHLAP